MDGKEKQRYLDPSLLLTSGQQNQVPKTFGPYSDVFPSACGRGWLQQHQPTGDLRWFRLVHICNAWWQENLRYIHGVVPNTEHGDDSSKHWDAAEGLFGETKELPYKHLWEHGKLLRTWCWNGSSDLIFWCSVLLLSLISFICPGHEKMQILTSQEQWRWKIWGSSTSQRPGWPQVEIRLQPNISVSTEASVALQFWYLQAPGARTIFVQLLTPA